MTKKIKIKGKEIIDLSVLPKIQRRIIILYFLKGKTMKEISRIVRKKNGKRMTSSGVKYHLEKAKFRLLQEYSH